MQKLFLLFFIFAQVALAKDFANQYCSFQLPTGWECELEGSEWVCQSTDADRKKEAIIVLAAKSRGEQDDMAQYQAYLKSPKTYTLPGGKKQVSEAKYTKRRTVNGHVWVDSLHLASEVPGFYTRYLATVKEDLGVAVTFSVSKSHYENYQGVFDKIIESLRVFRQKKVDLANYKVKGKKGNLIEDMTFIEGNQGAVDLSANKSGKGGGTGQDELMMYGLVAAAVVGFILMKKMKK